MMTDERLSVGRALLAALVVMLALSVLMLSFRPATIIVVPVKRDGGDDLNFDESDDVFERHDKPRPPDVIPQPNPETIEHAAKADDKKSHIRGI